jgi:outer membrane immunogenic protein
MFLKTSLACAGAFAAAAAFAGTAFAAEPAPTPPPPPVFTWTGFYVGGQIGYAWRTDYIYYSAFDPLSGLVFTPNVYNTPSGVIGGAHIALNYQIDKPGGGFVMGVEASVDGASLSNTAAAGFGAFGGTSVSASTNAEVQGSVRGRFGIAWGKFMGYVTGGVAFGGFNTSFSVAGNSTGLAAFNGGAPFFASNSFSNTRTGWTAGGGIDDAITDNWIVSVEYRYTDFSTPGNIFLAGPAFATLTGLRGGALLASRTLNQNLVQVGLSYKFDINAPNPEWFSVF